MSISNDRQRTADTEQSATFSAQCAAEVSLCPRTPGEAACNVQTLSSSVLFIRYLASVPHKHFSDKSLVSRPAPRPPSPRCCRQSPESHSWGSFLMIQTRSPADMLVMFDNWMIGSNSGSSRLKLLKTTYGQAVVRNPLW